MPRIDQRILTLEQWRQQTADPALGSLGDRINALEQGGGTPPSGDIQIVNYNEDLDPDLQNPGRGLEDSFSENESYAGYPWRIMRLYMALPKVDVALTSDWLNNTFAASLDAVVAQGLTCNLRPWYGVQPGDSQLSLSRIEGHIDQMLPILTSKAHAIHSVEVGWFGPWGETHGITSAGFTESTPSNGPQTILRSIVQRIMNGTPSTLNVSLRYPEVAMWIVNNGLSAAHQARLGIYNDDFLSSQLDGGDIVALEGGTFPGAWGDGIDQVRRDWLNVWGRTHPVRGESGVDGEHEGTTDQDFALIGDNALNYGFRMQHIDCLREWGLRTLVLDPKGIWDESRRIIGYRFVAKQGRYPSTCTIGQPYIFDLEIENEGVAPPRRPYEARVAFGASAEVACTMNEVNLNPDGSPGTTGAALDIKTFTGWISSSQPTTKKWVRFTATPPAGLGAGAHAIRLKLRDAYAGAQSNIKYNIRLANTGLWDSSLGRHNMNVSATRT